MAYEFLDCGELSCAEIARANRTALVGRVAVCTAWDSGLGDFSPPWTRHGRYFVSPPIDEALAANWPMSHDEFCDEWWIFDGMVPAGFAVHAFCNFIGMRIEDYRALAFEGGCPLDSYLERFRPALILGNNERAYVVRSVAGAR